MTGVDKMLQIFGETVLILLPCLIRYKHATLVQIETDCKIQVECDDLRVVVCPAVDVVTGRPLNQRWSVVKSADVREVCGKLRG